MYMIFLNTVLLYLNFRMIIMNLKQSRLYEFFELPFQYLFSILRYPYYVILMMICPMRTQPYFHDMSIFRNSFFVKTWGLISLEIWSDIPESKPVSCLIPRSPITIRSTSLLSFSSWRATEPKINASLMAGSFFRASLKICTRPMVFKTRLRISG